MATVTLDKLTKTYPNGFTAVSELDIGTDAPGIEAVRLAVQKAP